jgi:hypothetical protein
MKISFDYKNVDPEDIQIILEEFYKKYKNSKGTDGELVEIGKINIYISLKNQTDGAFLNILGDDGNPISWVIKNREIKNTNKKLLAMFNDSEKVDEKIFLYQDKERQNNRW